MTTTKPKYHFYLTSTFKSAWNVEFNHKIGPALESKGLKAYLPHRDTNQKGLASTIFEQDLKGITDSQKILAIGMNETPNWGGEIGFAYGRKIPIVGLTTEDHEMPLILNGMMSSVIRVKNLDEIDSYIDRLYFELSDSASR